MDNLIKGIAAALHFDYEGDPQSQALQEKIRECGVIDTTKEITGVTESALLTRIANAYETIAAEIQ